MNNNLNNNSKTMKNITLALLVGALAAPVTIAFGASAAVVGTLAAGVGISSIALGDYGKSTVGYRTTADAKRTQRHPLAA